MSKQEKAEKALEAARDRLSRAEAVLSDSRTNVRESESRTERLAGVDPAGSAEACRAADWARSALGPAEARVREALKEYRRLEAAVRARQEARPQPRQQRPGPDRGARKKAALAAMLARMGYSG